VWRWYPPTANLKLGLGWTGPYLIVKQVSPLTYCIQKTSTARKINVHVDHLKLYEGQNAPRNWIDPIPEKSESEVDEGLTDNESIEESVVLPEDQPCLVETPKRTRTGRIIKPRQIFSPN